MPKQTTLHYKEKANNGLPVHTRSTNEIARKSELNQPLIFIKVLDSSPEDNKQHWHTWEERRQG